MPVLELYRSGWRWAAGLDWSLVGLVVLIAQCRLVGARAGERVSQCWSTPARRVRPLLIGVIGAVLLVKPLSHAWRGQVAPVHLAVGILVGLLSSWSEIRMFPLVVIGLIAAAAPAHVYSTRQRYRWSQASESWCSSVWFIRRT